MPGRGSILTPEQRGERTRSRCLMTAGASVRSAGSPISAPPGARLTARVPQDRSGGGKTLQRTPFRGVRGYQYRICAGVLPDGPRPDHCLGLKIVMHITKRATRRPPFRLCLSVAASLPPYGSIVLLKPVSTYYHPHVLDLPKRLPGNACSVSGYGQSVFL